MPINFENVQITGGLVFAPEILTPTGDPYWANVSLLLNNTTSNNQTNNTFLDSSTNNFTVTRVGTSTKMFLNGVQEGSTATVTNNFSNTNFYIGRGLPSPFIDYVGYIQDVRITKGVARYTENFTPPTAPFPTF